MQSNGYPESRVHYICGTEEKTVPQHAPAGPNALLRLDTDWHASTKHELVHLYPLLVDDGVLILDEYGWWRGARLAVDEYFTQLRKPFYLDRVDKTGRCLNQ
jgi:O-methyltransferase